MSPRNRAFLLAATAVALVALFVVLRPTDSTDDPATPAQSTQATTPVTTSPTTASTPRTTSTPTTAPAPAEPAARRITVRGLEPVGGVQDLTYDKGETIRFVVSSDRAENVHLHGYDVEKAVAPGKAARFSVEADIDGIFEVELEDSAVPIAELTVNP